jgi:predicted nuclease of restriction endonuclease-like (RecB) superfamily
MLNSRLPPKKEGNIIKNNYITFLKAAKEKVFATRIQVAKAACQQQIELYWWFGQHIVKAQEKFGWGKAIVERFSKDLKKSFGGTFGFSVQNLWYMRQLFLEYKDHSNLQRLVGEVGWGQNLIIMAKVKNIKAREYYLRATIEMGWTRDVLAIQISSKAYERHALSNKQHNFKLALPKHLAEQAGNMMKDVYMLDTLGIAKPVLEAEIEAKMVNKIKDIMLELGYGFSFIGNQFRLNYHGNDYFIDLLFFNRRLNSLVALEIKTGKFIPEYAGKMNFYLNLLDDLVKEPHENHSIGIILCSERKRFEVEYALRGIEKPVGVAEFQLTRNLPSTLRNKLPKAEELEKKILKELDTIDN